MPEFKKASSLSEIPPGSGKTVQVEGNAIALFNINGSFHAIQNTCPHRNGPLGEGMVQGTTVSCPWHGWSFDVANGACHGNPNAKVQIYPTKVEGDSILIEI